MLSLQVWDFAPKGANLGWGSDLVCKTPFQTFGDRDPTLPAICVLPPDT